MKNKTVTITDLPLVGPKSKGSGAGDGSGSSSSGGGGTKGSTLFLEWKGRFIAFHILLKKERTPFLFLRSSVAFGGTEINKYDNN